MAGTPRRKVVVARNLGPDVMSLLNDNPELEVSTPGVCGSEYLAY